MWLFLASLPHLIRGEADLCNVSNRSIICLPTDDGKTSWCNSRNPFIVPSFIQSDFSSYIRGAIRCDENDQDCSMFSRFSWASFKFDEDLTPSNVFLVNLNSDDLDSFSNSLVLLDESLQYIDSLHSNGTYWDDFLIDSFSILGGSLTKDPFHAFGLPEDEIGPFFSHVAHSSLVTDVKAEHHQWTGWRSSYQSLNAGKSSGERLQDGAWFFRYEDRLIWAVASKHSVFDVYRLFFWSAEKPLDGHAWEIDREPRDPNFDYSVCATVEQAVNLYSESPCGDFYPDSTITRSCSAACKQTLQPIFGNRSRIDDKQTQCLLIGNAVSICSIWSRTVTPITRKTKREALSLQLNNAVLMAHMTISCSFHSLIIPTIAH